MCQRLSRHGPVRVVREALAYQLYALAPPAPISYLLHWRFLRQRDLRGWLLGILPYLAITSLVYLRLTTPTELRHARNEMLLPELGHLQLPDWQAVARDIIQTIREFLVIALPIL